jgi:23S rRNA (cytosine1962-C5)-methyltransferase
MAHRSYLDYQLLDSGNKQRLESVGGYTIVRPCSTATWKPSHPDAWQKAATTSQPLFWTTTYNCPLIQPLTLQLEKKTTSPQIGLFPEHEPLWERLAATITQKPKPPSLLNLFGYTGVASLVAAQAGANVTHVDSSAHALRLGQHSQKESAIDLKAIKWLCDDVVSYLKRAINKSHRFDIIIVDPPAFGRGTGNKIFRFEKDITLLLGLCSQLLSDNRSELFFTHYVHSYPAKKVSALLKDHFPNHAQETIPLTLEQKYQSNPLFCATSFILTQKN